MGTLQILAAAFLGSSIATAFVNYVLTGIRKREDQKRSARYLAHQICFILERYAVKAASDLEDHDTWEASDGHDGERMPKL